MICNLVTCHAEAARRYLPGWRCDAHTPAALAGRPETIPDPARTLTGLRAAKGLPDVAPPLTASQLVDDRAIASGKRRSSPEEFRAARAREEARKAR